MEVCFGTKSYENPAEEVYYYNKKNPTVPGIIKREQVIKLELLMVACMGFYIFLILYRFPNFFLMCLLNLFSEFTIHVKKMTTTRLFNAIIQNINFNKLIKCYNKINVM